MAKQDRTKSHYTPSVLDGVRSTLLEGSECWGAYEDHVVVASGLAVFHLTLDNPFGLRHVGTSDVDVVMNFKVIPKTGYTRIKDKLWDRGYRHVIEEDGRENPHSIHNPWTAEDGTSHAGRIDLLGPEYGGRGKGHEHQRVQDLLVRKIRGADIAIERSVPILIDGFLPRGGGRLRRTIRVAGLAPTLVMKAKALHNRAFMKDAYDIYMLIKCNPEGPSGAAQALKSLTAWRKLVQETIDTIGSYFGTADAAGIRKVVAFEEALGQDRETELARDVFFTLLEFLKQMG